MSTVCGLDFGTSNSALSVNIDGKVRLLDIDRDNSVGMTLKSVLYFYNEDQERNIYAGHEAVENYIDTDGEGRFLQSIKTFLPDSTLRINGGGGNGHRHDRLKDVFQRVGCLSVATPLTLKLCGKKWQNISAKMLKSNPP